MTRPKTGKATTPRQLGILLLVAIALLSGGWSAAKADTLLHSYTAWTCSDCVYKLAFPSNLLTPTQASAVLSGLEAIGQTAEDSIRVHLTQILQQQGVPADSVQDTVILSELKNSSCADCLATCKGRCVEGRCDDCFCYERINTPAVSRIVVLLLASPADESLALNAIVSSESCSNIPTLTEWGMIVFVVLLGGWLTFVVVRRWRRSHAIAA